MALTQTQGAQTRTQFMIPSSRAGASGLVYVVPEGKVFNGYLTFESLTSSSFNVNGSNIIMYGNGTYENRSSIPIYLGQNDILKNSGNLYFTLTGYEE